jgi:hypothetical protein
MKKILSTGILGLLMALFPLGKEGGEGIAYGGNGIGVLIYTLTEGNGMQLVVRQVNLAG